MKRKRPQIGDIIEMKTPYGLAYAQYTHKHPLYGNLLRVFPGLYERRPDSFKELVDSKERFYIFFPLGAAVSRAIVTLVDNEAVPLCAQEFPLMRKAGGIDRSGKVLNWWLWDGKREWRVDCLSQEQKKLSVAEVWNDTLLIERIVEGWSPQDEV